MSNDEQPDNAIQGKQPEKTVNCINCGQPLPTGHLMDDKERIICPKCGTTAVYENRS
jgi:DNA-directed RNA polymerase subunit RPC12/RpoP